MTNSTGRLGSDLWRPIDASFPRHLNTWILWDETYDRPAVAEKRSVDGRFWGGDWEYEIKATRYLPYTPPSVSEEKES